MATQITFVQKKVNAQGEFFIEGEELGDSPMIIISNPVIQVTNPIRSVERAGEKRYKITASKAYANNKVSGNAIASALPAAASNTVSNTLTKGSGFLAPLKNLFSFNVKQKSKKALLLQGIVLLAVVITGFKGAEYFGIIEPGTVPTIAELKDTGEKAVTGGKEGRAQVFNNHSFFDSVEAKRYLDETGRALSKDYTTFSPTLIVRKRPVRMQTLKAARTYCKNEIKARVAELEELNAVMENKTVARKLAKKSLEWTNTKYSLWDDYYVYTSLSNRTLLNQTILKIDKLSGAELDVFGSGKGVEGAREGLSDSKYRKKLKKITFAGFGLPDEVEIKADEELGQAVLSMDMDEKNWYRCIRDVPADQAVEVATK